MKIYIKSLALAMLAMGAAVALPSCSEEDIYNVNATDVPEAGSYAENIKIEVNQETNYATFSFTGKGVYPVWIIDGKSYSTAHEFTRYYRKAGDYSVEVKIGNANGVSQGTITKTFNIEKTKMTGFGGFVYESEYNLWTKATKKINSFYYAPGWSQINDPEHSFNGEEIKVSLSKATTDQWQAQMHVGTDISLNEGESYDGSFILTATKEMKNITIKIHPDGDDDDAHSFFPSEKVNLSPDEPKAFWFSNLPAKVPMNNLVITFDFGGNPEGVDITIENIVIKNHANDDGTVLPELPSTPEPNWVAVDSSDNLLRLDALNYTRTCYYAPGWAQIADPTITMDGNNFTVELPTATAEQWQAQVIYHTDLALENADTQPYDFKVTLTSNVKHPGVTVKVVEENIDDTEEGKRDANFFCAERVALEPETPTTFWVANVTAPKGGMHAVNLVLDFGGNADGTVVEVKDVVLQVHHD